LESEDLGQHLLGRDLGLPAIGLDRILRLARLSRSISPSRRESVATRPSTVAVGRDGGTTAGLPTYRYRFADLSSIGPRTTARIAGDRNSFRPCGSPVQRVTKPSPARYHHDYRCAPQSRHTRRSRHLRARRGWRAERHRSRVPEQRRRRPRDPHRGGDLRRRQARRPGARTTSEVS
jgi:hypothetical protein